MSNNETKRTRAIEKANAMVHSLCKGDRDWIMSIPSDRDRDPDLVILDGLIAGSDAVRELEERTTSGIKRIFLDMDGVLCDWVGAACRLFGQDPKEVLANWSEDGSIAPQLGVSMNELWRKVDSHGTAFWSELDPYPWASELWELCNSYAPTVVLTSPSQHHTSPAGKMLWMDKHLGGGKPFREFLMGPRKEFCAGPGSLLIDDLGSMCERFREFGGMAIEFPCAWNQHRELADDPMGFVRFRLGGMR